MHFLIDFESVTKYLLILLGLFEIEGVESIWDVIILAECFFCGDYRKCAPGAYFDNKKFVLYLLLEGDIIDLAHVKDHSILSGVVEFESFLAHTLDSVGSNKRIGSYVDFRHYKSFILFFELTAEVRVDN